MIDMHDLRDSDVMSRPDHELEEVARNRLWKSTYLELRRVSCSVRDRVLCLQGQVSSYYLRQVAQTILHGLDGLETIDNQLAVVRPQVA